MKQNRKDELYEVFNELGQQAISMNHYDLEEATAIPRSEWKEFLSEPDIKAFLKSERDLIKETELAKMLQDISDSNSTGKAQIINALKKDKNEDTKEGPTIIYTYVPPAEDESHCDNVVFSGKDVFQY